MGTKKGGGFSFGPLIAMGIIVGFLGNSPGILMFSIIAGILYAGYWVFGGK